MTEPISINPSKRSASPTRLQGVWSMLVRVIWVALALPILALVVSVLPQYVVRLKTPCFGIDWDCATGQLTTEQVVALGQYGLT